MEMLTYSNKQMRIARGEKVVAEVNPDLEDQPFSLGYYLIDALEQFDSERRATLFGEIIATFNTGALRLDPMHARLPYGQRGPRPEPPGRPRGLMPGASQEMPLSPSVPRPRQSGPAQSRRGKWTIGSGCFA